MSHITLNNVISFTERNSFHHNLNTFPISLPTSVLLSDPLSSFVLPSILPKPSIYNFFYLLPNSQPSPEDESSSECNLSVIEKCRLSNHQLLPEDRIATKNVKNIIGIMKMLRLMWKRVKVIKLTCLLVTINHLLM